MKNILFLLLLILSLNSFAAIVEKEIAEKVAKNFYCMTSVSYDKSMQYKPEDISLICINNTLADVETSYYIFEFQTKEGFIIVSASDMVKPILAYSFESKFNLYDIAPSQKYLLDYYQNMIIGIESGKVIPNNDALIEWDFYSNISNFSTTKNITTVPGLLENISWNQSMPYNAMCPQAEGAYSGYGGRCPVGCSAIAMLQIMKYYNWPSSGTGSYTHISDENGGFGNITVNFGGSEYDWSAMPDHASQKNDELAKMCFHAGVAIRMQWSPEGSGAWPEDVAFALVEYFGYENNISMIVKDDYEENDWKDMLRAQIDNKKPIFYVGYSDDAGHAWNCDGYQGDDYFHMNWGWGGYGNGFYTLDALGTSATPGNSEGNYNQWQNALIDIYPAGSYPTYCQENFRSISNEGSFDDGSSMLNYQNNQSCLYVIEPDCRQIVELGFSKFDLASGDILQLWDGSVEDNKIIGTFDNNNQPENIIYQATSGKLTILFNSDNTEVADGWKINYNTRVCTYNLPVTDASGIFDDGSGDCNYEKSMLCTWNICPENANRIFLNFDYFDINGNIDFVKIYYKKVNPTNLLYFFDQNNAPEETLIISSDTVIVQFFSGSNSLSGEGWKINYSSLLSESTQEFVNKNLNIYPNPGRDNSILFFDSEDKTSADICLVNALGEIVSQRQIELIPGTNQIPLNDLIKHLKSSVYFISIKVNNQNYYTRFVKLP